MQDIRRTVEAFLSLQGQTTETPSDLTQLVVQLAATTPSILSVYDILNKRTVFLNTRIYEMLGYPVETEHEAQYDLIYRLLHPDDIPPLVAMLREFETEANGTILQVEFRLRHANGDWHWFSSNNVVFQRDAQGKPIQILGSVNDITSHRQMEDAYRDKATLLQAILDTAVDAIITMNEEGIIETFNYAAECIFDYTAEEVIGQNINTLMPEPDPRSPETALNHFLQSDKRHFIGIGREVLGRRKDGTTIPLDLSVSEAWFGRRVFTGILRDLTERQRAANLLRESESRLQAILKYAPASIYVKDKEGRYVLSNRNSDAVLGVEPGGAIGKTDYDIFPREFADAFFANDIAVIESGKHQQSEEQLPREDKTYTFLSEKFPIRDAEGVPYAVCGISTDITDRKEIEETLRESEARFHLLADTAPVLIWTAGTDELYDSFNKPWLDFTGRTLEEERGSGWEQRIHPDDARQMEKIYRAAFAARQPFRREYRLLRRDKQYRWLLENGTPRFSPDGTFMGYIGSCIDVTDQKTLQTQLFETQKLESLGQLAGGIAHDFNNLLTAILGYAELSLMNQPEGSETARYLNNIKAASERAAELTKQLLMYARRQMVEFAALDINKTIKEFYPLLRRTIGEQYELVLALHEEPCFVKANVSQIEQVLTNLVVNARDAITDGGRILIETASLTLDDVYVAQHVGANPGEYVMIAVSDNGAGMTKEVQKRIFEPFYTTKEIGKGTGLGLATCYGIVKQSNGNIWVYSEVGQGTTFKVYLPRIPNPELYDGIRAASIVPKGTETILLVDDEPMVRDIAARTLEAHGYQVIEASNGTEALHLRSEWEGEIDLLITDVVMPLMGGKELAQRLWEQYPTLKVLYMSGYTQNVVLHQGTLDTGTALLTKPFTAVSLLKQVREMLNADKGNIV